MAFDKSKFTDRFLKEAREHLAALKRGLNKLEKDPESLDEAADWVRAAHTLKGSARILGFSVIASLAQGLESVLGAVESRTVPVTPPLVSLAGNSLELLGVFVNQVERGEEINTDIEALLNNLDLASRGQFTGGPENRESSAPPPEPPAGDSREAPAKTGKFDKTKFVRRFVDEAREHLDQINEGLVNLEAQPGHPEILDQIFRAAHTLKGASRILGFQPISLLAHKVEDALDALRQQRITQTRGLCDLLFKSVDLIAEFVERVAEEQPIETDIRPMIEALEAALRGEPVAAPELPAPVPGAGDPGAAGGPPVPGKPAESSALFKSAVGNTVRINTNKLDETVKLMGEVVSNHIRMKQNVQDIDEINRLSKKYLEQLSRLQQTAPGLLNGEADEVLETARTLHDKLRQLSAQSRDVMSFQTLVTDELREKVLRMRMLPLAAVLDGFPRLVRDLAASCKKQVRLEISGAETELDKKIIEKIGDPLLHMVRNSIDHGLELPEERAAAGKPETGTVRIRAGYEGGHVLIEISDDGRGIPVDRIREKALMKKLYDEESIDRLSESELINLIFQPGFSTSALVTEVSGRGVGMDVVRDNIIKHLKGSLQVETQAGRGTTFFIRLPLTLAVMRVMLVALGEHSVAIPLNAIREIVRVRENALIDVVNRRALSLRDQIIPVAELGGLLKLDDPPPPPRSHSGHLVVLIVAMGTELLGLVVDEIITEEDMEIKPLPDHMKDNELVSGVTLSGKNEVVLVLHVPRLFDLAREQRESGRETPPPASGPGWHVLVVDDSVSTRQVEKNILEAQGLRVDLAADGVEAYEKCMETTYDLVVTDIEMPRMDGWTLTEKLREESAYRHVPIIILSSRDREEDKRRGMEIGANAYLVKGAFDSAQLIETIQNLIA